MSHLCYPGQQPCLVFKLGAAVYDLEATPPVPIDEAPARHRNEPGAGAGEETILLAPAAAGPQDSWILIAGPRRRVWINGRPLELGLRVLEDRDHIRIEAREGFFFTREKLNQIEAFPGADHEVLCPRCKRSIEAGDRAVCCPLCGVWHHQTADRNCWTYAEACAACCRQSTDLDRGLQWIPEPV